MARSSVMFRLAVAAMLAVVVAFGAPTAAQPARVAAPEGPPRLLVLLVVDQMRADYVDRFQGDWTGGLKRLLEDGARFTNAAYPYLGTYTCAGHATIGTGAFPHVHGIFQNAWYDRARGENIPCTQDDTSKAVVYSGTPRDDGPGRLKVPTLADVLRARRGSRVVSVALKARSAIMLAGHGGDLVTWMTEAGDGWQTADIYRPMPAPVVRAFLDAHPVDGDYGKVWTRLLPPDRYPEPDDGEAEDPPAGWGATFPHPLTVAGRKPDGTFRELWRLSPFANDYVARMAATLAARAELGRASRTDVLAVSFSSPDLLAHRYGPHSQEVRDHYAWLDRSIGELLASLDTLVGRGRYVVALSADHGVADMPEQARRRGEDAGRLSTTALRDVIEQAAAQVLGPGRYVARMNSTDVYFRPGVFEALRARAGALEAIARSLETRPGIARVLRADRITGQSASSDPLVRAAALSHVPDASGDLLVLSRPGWIYASEGTTHGSANPLDQRVPIVLMGPGIRPGLYEVPATPADVAPTLARLAGVVMDRAEGRPLVVALTPTAAPAR